MYSKIEGVRRVTTVVQGSSVVAWDWSSPAMAQTRDYISGSYSSLVIFGCRDQMTTFEGAMEGHVFGTRDGVTGYYPDPLYRPTRISLTSMYRLRPYAAPAMAIILVALLIMVCVSFS